MNYPQPTIEPIDLGLPSGVMWANMNLGANGADNNGLYFSWGNIIGHERNEGYNFSDENYANTPGASLVSSYAPDSGFDAARQILGENWRVPSQDDVQELLDNCDTEWITIDEMRYKKLTSRINGKSIVIPAAGEFSGTTLRNNNTAGYNQTSNLFSQANIYYLVVNSSNAFLQHAISRSSGMQIRPVYQPSTE